MKLTIISPDASGGFEGTMQSQILRHLPAATSESAANLNCVPVAYYPDFRFNPSLLHMRKPYVLMDMTEYAWDWNQEKDNVLGRGITRHYGHIASDEWAKLDDFVRDRPPLIQFKRELKSVDESARLRPLEYLCYLDIPSVQSREEFDARRIEVNHTWGFSHPSRVLLHASIFEAMTTMNLGVISELNHLEGYFRNPNPRTWASIYKPWYARSAMSEIMALNVQSKLSVSLPGAGVKCFRSAAESPVGSIMALQEDAMVWSYPWEHGKNCIRLRPGHEFEDLEHATQRTDLWEIYRAGQENIARYRTENYLRDYLLPTIQQLL